MRLRASDLSFYDGNVNNPLRWDGYANCDDPEQDIISYDYLFTVFISIIIITWDEGVTMPYFHSWFWFIPYQYVICTWLFLWKLSMFSATSALLASRRAPDASFSSPRQGSSWKSDLILFPVIILERTGSTEQMDVTPVSSERQIFIYVQICTNVQESTPVYFQGHLVWSFKCSIETDIDKYFVMFLEHSHDGRGC